MMEERNVKLEENINETLLMDFLQNVFLDCPQTTQKIISV